jgi:hypothetical protein
LAIYDVELDFVAFFERFVSIHLDGGIVDKHIWPVFTPNESETLGIVEPLDHTFVLSHRGFPSFF